ncbi:MAG TPA: hypothetical protein VLF79_02575 [Candidatus Saccharimonadales bacterium]|nr:hypothetical protein [Candidatus Saccharimonadales bacterium]
MGYEDNMSSLEVAGGLTLFSMSVLGGLAVSRKLREHGKSRPMAAIGGVIFTAVGLEVSPFIIENLSRPQDRQNFVNFVAGVD